MPPTGVLAGDPGMYPNRESNQLPFGSQASTHSTEPHQPGLFIYFQREGKGGRRKGRETLMEETSIPYVPRLGDPTCNPGMRPDGESKQQAYTLQKEVQPTEPHHSGLALFFIQVIRVYGLKSDSIKRLTWGKPETILSVLLTS